MNRILYIFIFVILLTSCSSGYQTHDRIIHDVEAHIEYVSTFGIAFEDFKIYKIEYLEDDDTMYYLISYEGYYTIDVDALNIKAGNKLDSSTLCSNNIETKYQSCLSGVDVTGDKDLAVEFWRLYDEPNEHNYYVFTDDDLNRLN